MKNIVQNVWSPYVFDRVKNMIMGGDTPWFLCITDYYSETPDPHSHKYQHIAYHKDVQQSQLGPELLIACGDAISRSGQNIDEILRIRCSVTGITEHNHVADPHVDTNREHMTALFYINDSDGDTIVYNEQYRPLQGLDQTEWFEQKIGTPSVDYTVTPVANQMCWFNGLTYHSSNSPTTVAQRYIINVNYTVHS